MTINIFRKSHSYLKRWPKLQKAIELTIKTIFVLLIPLIFSIISILIWIFVFYRQNIHLDNGMETIIIDAWIPMFGILYSLLMAIVLTTVWNEYKAMRLAVKKWDTDTFMNLRDEEMSPLVLAMVLVFLLALLLAFMVLHYPTQLYGAILVGSTTYLLSLILFVIIEIDNPCSGFWFIKSIPEAWLTINPKVWREKRSAEAKKQFNESWHEITSNK